MKRLVLRSTKLLSVIFLFAASTSCNKQRVPAPETLTTGDANNLYSINNTLAIGNPFNKSVGAPVDGAVGDKWKNNYKLKYNRNHLYTLNSKYLQDSILKQPNCVGIALYYGLDDFSSTHILPIGIDANGKIMKRATVSTMQGPKSWAIAQLWISRHPGLVDAHFHGSDLYGRLNLASCESILVDFAIDDKNKQQLLLSNPCVLNAIKKYQDEGAVCPTICPKL